VDRQASAGPGEGRGVISLEGASITRWWSHVSCIGLLASPISAKTFVPVRTGVALCLPVHRARNGHESPWMRSLLPGALRRRDVQEHWIANRP
jgi:hypothetical protein